MFLLHLCYAIELVSLEWFLDHGVNRGGCGAVSAQSSGHVGCPFLRSTLNAFYREGLLLAVLFLITHFRFQELVLGIFNLI